MKIYEYIVRIKDQATDKLRRIAGSGNSIMNTFRRMGSSIGNFGSQISRFGGQVMEAFGLSSSLARTLGPLVLGAAMAFTGRQAIMLAADLEQTTVGFEVMLGSVEKANKMVSDLRQFAKVTPFETADLVKATEILLGFGVAGDQIMPTIAMLGDVSRGSADKLRLVSLAYAQVQAAGRLMGQDLLQLVNAGFNPLQQISQKTGKSLAVLKKEMEDGKISASMVTQAFRDATSQGGRFFGMMDRQSKTFHGMMSTLRDEWTEALIDIGTRMLLSAIEAVKGLRSVLNDLTTRVDFAPLIAGFRDTWQAIMQTRDIFADLLQRMGVSSNQINLLQVAVNALALTLRVALTPLRFVLSGFRLFVEIVSKAVDVGTGFGKVMAGLFTKNVGLIITGFNQVRDGLANGFENVRDQITEFAKTEATGFSSIFTTGPKTGNPLAAAGVGGNVPGAKGADGASGKVQDGIDRITGGGKQAVNVTINLENLIGVQNFDVTNVKETVQDMQKMVTEALLRTLNSANYAASQ